VNAQAHLALLPKLLEPQQARRVSALLSKKKGRASVIALLSHYLRLDDRYTRALRTNELFTDEDLVGEMRKLGAPRECYVVSEDKRIDDRMMDLEEAFSKLSDHDFGTLVSCIPGTLAYYEPEDVGLRYIFNRTQDQRRSRA